MNTVKRWAAGGVVAVGRPERVTPATQAKAAAALAEWESKKARARALPGTPRGGGGRKDLAALPGVAGEPGKVIDLALTKDGRKSFKRQGKWGHGFVPLDKKAKEAKAKGSPIAMRRMNRLYGTQTESGNKKSDAHKPVKQTKHIQVTSKSGRKERVKDIGHLRRVKPVTTKKTQRTENPSIANQGKRTRRSDKAWNEIPETQKTIRNGKRYTLTTYRGKTQLTEWFGPNYNEQDTNKLGKRVLRSVNEQQLSQMSTAQLRQLLRVKGQPKHVKTAIHKMIAKKMLKRKKAA